ncbi:MAG: class I SAM-dependent methyltransferase [Spirochaetes bacterium]|nr:class I SAM-dependent methyltransferase [Spirochaetota bacterium]
MALKREKSEISDVLFSVVQCKSCGLAFVNPRPVEADMGKFYTSHYHDTHTLDGQNKRYLYFYELIKKYRSNKKDEKILDIGCSAGGFLKVCSDNQMDPYGVEYHKPAIGNPYNFKIQYGNFAALDFKPNFFDMVTGWAVFEHLHDPMSYFKKVQYVLKPGGYFIILVPNLNSIGSRFAYEEDVPRHLFFFSKKSLRQYAEKTNFEVCDFIFTDEAYRGDGISVLSKQFFRLFRIPIGRYFDQTLPAYIQTIKNTLEQVGKKLILPTIPLQKRLGFYGVMIVVFKKNS